jgi:very-short-patch-repair endonuclease
VSGTCQPRVPCDSDAMTINRPRHRYNVPSARELCTSQTPTEALLWESLRNPRLAGLKFRRRHPVGPFVVDFSCPDRRLAIELDGDVHSTQQVEDAEREALLAKAGYRMLRFSNQAVQNDLPSVLIQIRTVADSEPSRSAQPIPRTGDWN